MRVPDDHDLSVTLALLRDDNRAGVVEELRRRGGKTALDGLVDLLLQPPTARAGTLAIEALEEFEDPVVIEALLQALQSNHVPVRLLAVRSLHRRQIHTVTAHLLFLLQNDRSWLIRRAGLLALAEHSGPEHWGILHASTDPHWRARHALIRVLLSWGRTTEQQREIEDRLCEQKDLRSRGVLAYLRHKWRGEPPPVLEAPPDPLHAQPWWDWDPAVLARNLDQLGRHGRRDLLEVMPRLLGHEDERVRQLALDTLQTWGETRHIVETLTLLDEPRQDAFEAVEELLNSLGSERAGEAAFWLQSVPSTSANQLAWAREGRVRSEPIEVCPRIREARELSRDDPRLREFQADPHPQVRAAALTAERAAELIANPTLETSWHALAAAARIARVPRWKLEPGTPWQPPPLAPIGVSPLNPTPGTAPLSRPFGPEGWPVAPLGVSGHYGLAPEGFVRAIEAGVNLLFWEPNYQGLTDFSTRLSSSLRRELHFVAGTFEAEGKRIRRDAERALRALHLERLSVFLLFWVRSWQRITDEVRQTLDQLRQEGKLATVGLSTHSRPLALEAVDQGWNPVMVRHSAAHRGAERAIFSRALERGTTLMTFNSTCYGRLLEPLAPGFVVEAADCYRYSLSFEAVRVCWTAPASPAELEANLQVLTSPLLSEERRQMLLRQGDLVYEADNVFRKTVRGL